MRPLSFAVVAVLGLLVVAQVAQADPVGGTKSGHSVVAAFSTDVYTVRYYAGQLARLTVDGDGDTDLDVFVYDENGHLIVSDTGISDHCVVVWQPRWTGRFTIRIVNRGAVYNRYTAVAD